jgi:hypothetical protein
MDHFLDWLDRGSWLLSLRHDWAWAAVTMVLAVISIAGIAAVARRYGHRQADVMNLDAGALSS